MTEELQEQLKMVAHFMECEYMADKDEWILSDEYSNVVTHYNTAGYPASIGKDSLKFHTDWSWQVPAWSKVCKKMRIISSSFNYSFYNKINQRHSKSTRENEPEEGFKVLVEAIKWIKENKQ